MPGEGKNKKHCKQFLKISFLIFSNAPAAPVDADVKVSLLLLGQLVVPHRRLHVVEPVTQGEEAKG